MKRKARIMMAAFSKNGAGGSAAIRMIPDSAAMVGPAVRAAVTTAQRPSAA